jgi:hypothetical protein
MKITKSKLRETIKEEIEKDPALLDAIRSLTSTIDGLDISVDFLAAAVTGEDPISIGSAQGALGRAYRPSTKKGPTPPPDLSEAQPVDQRENPTQTMASKFAAGDIAKQPEGSRSELAQLFRNLLGELGEANPEEVEALADTVAALIPASGENVSKNLGLEEGVENLTPENLKLVFDVLVKMAPMLGMLAIGTPLMMAIEKKLNNRELEEDDSFSKAGEEIEKKGTEGVFTAKAKKRGMSAQEFARKVLANTDEYDTKTVRQASFAKGAATVARNKKK